MRTTLSQSLAPPAVDPTGRRAGRILRILGMLFLLAATHGCDRLESKPLPESDAQTAAPFEWPDDPNHATLSVEIETDSIEFMDRIEGGAIITIELMPELAPISVARVIDLAKDGYYDGTTFHRVIPGFMIQGGDPNSRDRNPNNDGNGNPELHLPDEFGEAPFLRGVVGMGNLGRKNSTGGQFFIMQADAPSLEGRYTVIGRVVSGIEVVDAITEVSIDRVGRWGPKDRPIENVWMKRVAIRELAAGIPLVGTQSGGDGAALDSGSPTQVREISQDSRPSL